MTIATCKECIHYNICSLWSTTDLESDEAYKFCFGNFKPASDVVPRSEIARQIFAEIDYFIDLYKKGHFYEKSLLENISAIKKKYTEGKSDGRG